MSDALPLPPRPNLEQYKKLAKDFQHACKSGDPGAIRDWAARWAETLARLQGQDDHAGSPKRDRRRSGTSRAAAGTSSRSRMSVRRAAPWPTRSSSSRAGTASRAGRSLPNTWKRWRAPIRRSRSSKRRWTRSSAATWRRSRSCCASIRSWCGRVRRANIAPPCSTTSRRTASRTSARRRRKNIVEITKLLLEAGADVNAESDAYGGRSTTLGLTATSCHPEEAGVQLPLMELLIEHGAIDRWSGWRQRVVDCLHNGRGEAAEFFAKRGARLDLEGAAGVGRLDVVKSFFQRRRQPEAAGDAEANEGRIRLGL